VFDAIVVGARCPRSSAAATLLAKQGALDGSQETIDEFLGLDASTGRPADFLSPGNMERIFAQANAKDARAQKDAAELTRSMPGACP
jgi:hypothetical protein